MKKTFYLLAAALVIGTSSFIFAAQKQPDSATESSRIINLSKGDNNYEYEKQITAVSNLGTTERYDLYRDENRNFCVRSRHDKDKRYIELVIYNEDGFSHTFVDGTRYYCNVY